MFQHQAREPVSFKTYVDWFTLSFLAGNINAGGYLSCHRFVSHVTGFATLSGISFYNKDFFDAIGTLLIPIFFLLGVMFSGYLTEKQFAHRLHGEKYAPVMEFVALLLGIVVLGGHYNWFGEFGEPAKLKHDFLLLACLVGACGLQNGAITNASGFTIRTTHLTGLTTDLGLGIIRQKYQKLTAEQLIAEKKANFLRIGTILSFTLGSTIGAFLYTEYKYMGFIFPMLLALYFAFTAQRFTRLPR